MGERRVSVGQRVDLCPVEEMVFGFFPTEQHGGERGGERKCVESRDGDRKGDGQRELFVENAGGAGEEADRDEHTDEHKRGRDDGAGDFGHSDRSGFVWIVVGVAGVCFAEMALDVFDDYDGVVNDETCGQRNAEQRERVDGEVKDLDEREGSYERDGNRDRRDDGRAPIEQEEEDDDDNDDDGFGEGDDDFVDGVADNGRGIECNDVVQARGEGLGELQESCLGFLIDFECVGVGELLDADTDGRLAGELEVRGVVFGADLGASNVLELDDAGGAVFENDVVELFGRAEATDGIDGDLEVLRTVDGRGTDCAGGDFYVLLLECVDDVGRGELASGELGGIKPQTHGVLADAEDLHVAYAGDALERIFDVEVDVVGDEVLRVAVVVREEAGGEDEVRVRLGDGDAGVLNRLRKHTLGAGDAVLNVDGSDVEVVAGLEGDGDGTDAAVGAGRGDVTHALDAVDLFFKNSGDVVLYGLGVGTDVGAGDRDLWRSERGVQRNG